jgi:tripartite-type tricarboxylate transporter receptor subunit TctC
MKTTFVAPDRNLDRGRCGPPCGTGLPDKPVQYIVPFAAPANRTSPARLQAQVFADEIRQGNDRDQQAGAGGGLAWSQMNSMPGRRHTIIA